MLSFVIGMAVLDGTSAFALLIAWVAAAYSPQIRRSLIG